MEKEWEERVYKKVKAKKTEDERENEKDRQKVEKSQAM